MNIFYNPLIDIAPTQYSRNTKKCQEKTARGNVYPTKGEAEFIAAKLRRRAPRVVAYHCPNCELYHVGKQHG